MNGAARRGIAWRELVVALLLSAAVLAHYRRVYWRPFDDSAQESTVSFQAYGFAAASGVGLWPNPIVARQVDVRNSRVKAYPHWPNGFFLLLEGVLEIFGRTEAVGRSFATAGTMLGFTLLILSIEASGPLVYAALPLILASAAGRDSVPFVFIDVALYVWLGLLYWTSVERPHANPIFRTALALAPLFNPLVAPYAAVIALLKWQRSRSARDLLLDLVTLGAAGALVLAAIAAGAGGLQGGAGELTGIYRFNLRGSSDPWARLLIGDVIDSFHLGPAGAVLVACAWVLAVRSRQWRIAALLPSFLLFAALLPGYVHAHRFARLPFVFFSLVTLMAAVETALGRVAAPWFRAAGRIGVGVGLALGLSAAGQQYTPDPQVQWVRGSLLQIVQDPANRALLDHCNAFEFRLPPEHHFFPEYNPANRIGQFFFGRQVVERVRRGDAVRRCVVDLANRTISPAMAMGEVDASGERR